MHAFHHAHMRIFFSKLMAWGCLSAAFGSGVIFAQTCPFDDGHSSLEVEGLILTRYALGITGAPLVASTGINAVDAPTVEASINCPSCGLNITGNPALTVADATIISRKLAGFSGTSLTDGVALGSGTRNTPAAVQSFLLSGCGATGGTVTSITAGTGLSGGVITGAGTISLASTQLLPTTACSTDQMIKWNGSAWVCAVAVPAFPDCSGRPWAFLPSGSVGCGQGVFTPGTIQLVGDVRSSIGLAADGLPIISIIDDGTSLRILKCANAICSSAASQIVVETGASGFYDNAPSMIVPVDGKPVIAYTDHAAADLKVAKCVDAGCVSAATITPVDSVGSVGYFPVLTVPPDGRPFVAYFDLTNKRLKGVKCGNAACSSGNVITVLDNSSTDIGRAVSIALPADGLPIIIYADATNSTLKYLKCGNANCNSGNLINIVPGVGGSINFSAMAIPTDGRPYIAYYKDASPFGLYLMRCGNAFCSTGNVTIAQANYDTPTNLGYSNPAITLAADETPVVGYYDPIRENLAVLKCTDANCFGKTFSFVDMSSSNGMFPSILMPPDGLPLISYADATNRRLKVVKCANAACTKP